MRFADLGPKLQARRDEIVREKKKAARKAKRQAKKKASASKPIKKKPLTVKTKTEWIGDPLDDPLPF